MIINYNTIINTIWLTVGFGGQAIFSMRFIVQWLHSERQKRSVIPLAFWYLSIFGAITLLAYAIHKRDPVFIAGQAFGILVYSRNLYFIYKEKQALVKTS
jgi:lipid-A-disaccharide synthase-like uncharacterized protein